MTTRITCDGSVRQQGGWCAVIEEQKEIKILSGWGERSSYEMEILAITNGLKELGPGHVEIRTDLRNVVGLINHWAACRREGRECTIPRHLKSQKALGELLTEVLKHDCTAKHVRSHSCPMHEVAHHRARQEAARE